MKYQKELGFKALGSLLKWLYDHFIWESNKLYKQLDTDIEANWVLIFTLLDRHKSLSVTEIADFLQFKHPTIHTLVNKLIKKGYVAEKQDKEDKRRRLLKLTKLGHQKLEEARPIWESAEEAVEELVDTIGANILPLLHAMTNELNEKSFKERVLEKLEDKRIHPKK